MTVVIKKAQRSKTSFCRVCGKCFERGEKYFALSGSFRVMRALMCMDHFNVRNCSGCEEKQRMKCITQNKQSACIKGTFRDTVVEEE